jgi:hypothetical protein
MTLKTGPALRIARIMLLDALSQNATIFQILVCADLLFCLSFAVPLFIYGAAENEPSRGFLIFYSFSTRVIQIIFRGNNLFLRLILNVFSCSSGNRSAILGVVV